MKSVVGICALRRSETGDHAELSEVRVRVRGRGVLGYRVEILAGDDATADSGQACLLPPGATAIMRGTAEQIEGRRRRMERLTGSALTLAPLTERGGEATTVLAHREAAAGLPAGARGVPIEVALARLVRTIVGRRTVGVYWSDGEERALTIVKRGVPAAGPSPGLSWLLLAEPDEEGARRLERAGATELLEPRRDSVAGLAPRIQLALGVALACRDPGTLPALARRRSLAIGSLARLLLLVLLAGFTVLYLDGALRAKRIRRDLEAVQQQLEREQWQRGAPIFSLPPQSARSRRP